MKKKVILPFIKDYYVPDPIKPATYHCKFCGITYCGGHVMRMLGHLLPTTHPLGKKKPCRKVENHIREALQKTADIYLKHCETVKIKKEEGSPAPASSSSTKSFDMSPLITPRISGSLPLNLPFLSGSNDKFLNLSAFTENSYVPTDKSMKLFMMGIAVGEIPVEIIDSDYFKAFLAETNVTVDFPSRSEINHVEYLIDEHTKLYNNLSSSISHAKYVHLALDSWTQEGRFVAGIVVFTPFMILHKVIDCGSSGEVNDELVLQEVLYTIEEIGSRKVVSFIHDNTIVSVDHITDKFPWVITPTVSFLQILEQQGICLNLQSSFEDTASDLASASSLIQILQPQVDLPVVGKQDKSNVIQFMRSKLSLHPDVNIDQLVKDFYDWLTGEGVFSRHDPDYSEAWRVDAVQDTKAKVWWLAHYSESPLSMVYNMLCEIPDENVIRNRNWSMDGLKPIEYGNGDLLTKQFYLKYNNMARAYYKPGEIKRESVTLEMITDNEVTNEEGNDDYKEFDFE